jgi:hypothetical protein
MIHSLDDVERGLVWRGLRDLENAASSLRNVGDTQAAVFDAHAAAEKFLKVALKRSGCSIPLQSLGHRLPQIFDELVTSEERYSWLKSSVDSLQALAPNMQIRYGIVPRTVENDRWHLLHNPFLSGEAVPEVYKQAHSWPNRIHIPAVDCRFVTLSLEPRKWRRTYRSSRCRWSSPIRLRQVDWWYRAGPSLRWLAVS